MIKNHNKPVLLSLVISLLFSHMTISIQPDTAQFQSLCRERLQKPIDLLQRVRCKKESFFEWGQSDCNCAFETYYQFKHPETARCVRDMEQNKDFEPLIRLSHDFNNHTYLDDDLFVREYLIIIFVAYRNLILNNASTNNKQLKKSVMSVMVTIYEAINYIPPTKILEAIELLAYELPSFLEHHEFHSDLTWKEWLKKHWMVPLGLIYFGIILLNIVGDPISRTCKRISKANDKEHKKKHHHRHRRRPKYIDNHSADSDDT